MIEDKGIRIKNIYYMLTYAFRALLMNNFEEIAGEDFDHIHDLFAAILAEGVSTQLKQGLYRQYIGKQENIPVLRGKLALAGTLKNRMARQQVLACEFDELSEDNVYNQILKVAMTILARQPAIKSENKARLHKLLFFFKNISDIDPSTIQWATLPIFRGNQNYRMLINIAFFVLTDMLLTTEKGQYKLIAFSDNQMNLLYERFILEYYKKHHPYLKPKASQIHWLLDEGSPTHLPIMQTDTTLEYAGETLIIDAKYYGETMQRSFDKPTYHSANLYQVFSYVKNLDKDQSGKVSGLLLYAKTSESVTPDADLVISGNRISVKTLDLNQPFNGIKKELDACVPLTAK